MIFVDNIAVLRLGGNRLSHLACRLSMGCFLELSVRERALWQVLINHTHTHTHTCSSCNMLQHCGMFVLGIHETHHQQQLYLGSGQFRMLGLALTWWGTPCGYGDSSARNTIESILFKISKSILSRHIQNCLLPSQRI